MKNIFIPVIALFFVGCTNDTDAVNTGTSSAVAVVEPQNGAPSFEEVKNPVKPEGTTSIEYVETEHDFGTVQYPGENLHTFKFKNTGSVPLVIESAKASCGCTVPNKPDEPIMPGEMGEMDVIFRPKEGQVGQPVTKTVTVTANTDPVQTYLKISAVVK
jgi:hypothetical protein